MASQPSLSQHSSQRANPKRMREALHERKRIGKRWKGLCGSLPLLLLVYTEEANCIMYVGRDVSLAARVLTFTSRRDSSKVNSSTIYRVAAYISDQCPKPIAQACRELMELAALQARQTTSISLVPVRQVLYRHLVRDGD
jgi:hypothetical protein